MRCDQFNDFYEHDHGYVFNRQQLEELILQVRKEALQEAVTVCADLSDMTKPCPTGNGFNHAYIFAMDRIRDIMYEHILNKGK